MKTYFTVFIIVMISSLFSETSLRANDDDKVVTDFISLIISDRAVSIKDYEKFNRIALNTEFEFGIMRCRKNEWNPYSDRCYAINHLSNPRGNSFFMEWVKERFSTSGQDYEIIRSIFVKHAASADDFWLVEVLIGEYVFVLKRYTPRTAMGELISLLSAYKKDDNGIPYSMWSPPSSCNRGVYNGTYDFKVDDEIQATLDISTDVLHWLGTGSISGRYTRMPIEISWYYLDPDVIRIESKSGENDEENNYLRNALRQLAGEMDNADLTPFDMRLEFGLYADCKYGVINRMYFYSNEDTLFFERRTMMPDIIKDPQILLYNAVQEGDIAEVLRLLKAGVDMDAKIHGYTVLTLASFRGYTEIVQALIDAGVDVNAASEIALKTAEKEGHTDVILLLRNAGAK